MPRDAAKQAKPAAASRVPAGQKRACSVDANAAAASTPASGAGQRPTVYHNGTTAAASSRVPYPPPDNAQSSEATRIGFSVQIAVAQKTPVDISAANPIDITRIHKAALKEKQMMIEKVGFVLSRDAL